MLPNSRGQLVQHPLDQAARVCLLIHVGVAQASTRMYLERPVRPLVSIVEQVSVERWMPQGRHGMPSDPI
jgi:hypothetical protein